MKPEFPDLPTKTLAVKLSKLGERSVRAHHPWIFSDSIVKINKEGTYGDVAVIFALNSNKAIGVGLYDPGSPIRIKMLHFDEGAKLSAEFFRQKIENAFELRQPLLKTKTNSYRLLFGENDGFPGFIADVYADVLVIKLYSAIWWPYLETILNELISVSKVKTGVLRLGRNVQKEATHGFNDGQIIFGSLKNETIEFQEHGIKFSANVIHGHKTGYFLDHRLNRKKVGALSRNKTVLDVFAYAGGFSVHALANEAKEVTSLDISNQALELAIANGKLNPHSGKHTVVAADAFDQLEQWVNENRLFDVVVIDPPSFAKRASEVPMAHKKYEQLARLGAALVAKKGLLVLASCSSRVTENDFFSINDKALNHSGRPYEQVEVTKHDVDHPVTFDEGTYLKCGYYRFNR